MSVIPLPTIVSFIDALGTAAHKRRWSGEIGDGGGRVAGLQ
jgi:hypothetical protein